MIFDLDVDGEQNIKAKGGYRYIPISLLQSD